MKTVTVVYEIVDESEWSKRNPLHYSHDGLKALRVGIGDAIEARDALAEQVITVLEGIGSEDALERMAEDILHGRPLRDASVSRASEVASYLANGITPD